MGKSVCRIREKCCCSQRRQILCRKEIQYVKMSLKEREQLHAEFSILSSLRHPNIVAYYHRNHLKPTQELHLYMEYCGGGDLSRVIKQLIKDNQFAQEEYVWSIFSQLVTALYRCHHGVDPPEVGNNFMGPIKEQPSTGLRRKDQVMILHRDLKPENGKLLLQSSSTLTRTVFLGEDSSVKLGDFGLSKLMSRNDFASTYVGTPYYMSPEICAAERYTLHSDIWSLGCIIYELCAKRPPFDARTHFELIQKIKSGRFDPLPSVYSPELQDVVKNCLRTNPLQRPDTASLLQLPVVRMMRKERQVVDLGNELREKARQLESKASVTIAEQNRARSELEVNIRRDWEVEKKPELEATLRREWEVKARLEIDRQVQKQIGEAQKGLELQFQTQLKLEVEKHLRSLQTRRRSSGVRSPVEIPTSSISTSGETDYPYSTDVTSLSLDSPVAFAPQAISKKVKRTPFTRARTQFDSPMDIQMGEPSPMSIASLSLSPRRAAALGALKRSNIFVTGAAAIAAAARTGIDEHQHHRWNPRLVSRVPSDSDSDNDILLEDATNDVPSPTRLPRSYAAGQDPFKAPLPPAAQHRPTFARQQTAPAKRLSAHAPLFAHLANPLKADSASPALAAVAVTEAPITSTAAATTACPPTGRIPTPVSPTRAASPLRRFPSKNGKLTKPALGSAAAAAVAAAAASIVPVTGVGRTLVELQQARAGGAPIAATERMADKEACGEGALWDPERDEMPSPFLVRGRRAVVGGGAAGMGYGFGR